ncbi:hypothetical protein K7887_18455 [Sutcliffiella horikoshii]|uniref:hypothetical protein n=1 Tax=Sutcliffiella horikoshii TaxID=79883 RepID=UPI001CBCD3CD|nr:hypothetical protein [Sutcliffiella horikoshii]UAL46824.1 hypothetical protein K7887_18455 [Sutcliffiella horikoshii]
MVLHVDRVNLHQEMKRNFVLDQLRQKGVLVSQSGTELEMMSYQELKYELVLLAFREIDADKDDNKWF